MSCWSTLLLRKAGEKVPMYESIQKMWLAKLIFEKLLYFGKLVVRALGRYCKRRVGQIFIKNV
jgi:hypothetical protein